MMHMAKAVRAGIHRTTLYAMRDAGVIEQLSRGFIGWRALRRWRIPTWWPWHGGFRAGWSASFPRSQCTT
jgi:hypothetical protein